MVTSASCTGSPVSAWLTLSVTSIRPRPSGTSSGTSSGTGVTDFSARRWRRAEELGTRRRSSGGGGTCRARNSNKNVRKLGERSRSNAKVQGTRRHHQGGMVDLQARLRLSEPTFMQVHDERSSTWTGAGGGVAALAIDRMIAAYDLHPTIGGRGQGRGEVGQVRPLAANEVN